MHFVIFQINQGLPIAQSPIKRGTAGATIFAGYVSSATKPSVWRKARYLLYA